MKLLALALFVALFTVVTCQVYFDTSSDPEEPKWPSMYSATVEWRSHKGDRHHSKAKFFRIFWDEKNNRARTGGMVKWEGKHYKMEAIYHGEKHTAYYIFYGQDHAKCFTVDLKNKTITSPDLSDAKYNGMAVVEYHPVYHWEKVLEKCDKKINLRVFDTQEDREIKRVDYSMSDHHDKSGTMMFHEVNYGPQADSLFKIPKLILDQCGEKLEEADLHDINDPLALLAQFPLH
jgi:hypothetical protein